jgi:hypothetical protein
MTTVHGDLARVEVQAVHGRWSAEGERQQAALHTDGIAESVNLNEAPSRGSY